MSEITTALQTPDNLTQHFVEFKSSDQDIDSLLNASIISIDLQYIEFSDNKQGTIPSESINYCLKLNSCYNDKNYTLHALHLFGKIISNSLCITLSKSDGEHLMSIVIDNVDIVDTRAKFCTSTMNTITCYLAPRDNTHATLTNVNTKQQVA